MLKISFDINKKLIYEIFQNILCIFLLTSPEKILIISLIYIEKINIYPEKPK